MEIFHKNGYILRNFKDENILIKRKKRQFLCKLIDFSMSGYFDKKINLKEYDENSYQAPELFQ